MSKNVEITTHVDGWTAIIPGGSLYGAVGCFGLGGGCAYAVFGVGSVVLCLFTLVDALRTGDLARAAVAMGGALFGIWLAAFLPFAIYNHLRHTHIEVVGRSVRMRKVVLGLSFGEVVLELAECTPLQTLAHPLVLGGHRIPVADGVRVDEVVACLQEGAAAARAHPAVGVPLPAQLEALRAEQRE